MTSKETLKIYTNADLSAGSVSGQIAVNKHDQIEFYGNTDGSGFIGIQVSTDGVNYFSSSNTIHYNGNIYGRFPCYAPVLRLSFVNDMSGLTLNATLSGI